MKGGVSMSEQKVSKRGANRPKEAIVSDLDERIQKHEVQIQQAEEKCNSTVAYHRACIATLKDKREAKFNPKERKQWTSELKKKLDEKGMTMDDLLTKIDQMD
jgi:seryl-tRNA synthetase